LSRWGGGRGGGKKILEVHIICLFADGAEGRELQKNRDQIVYISERPLDRDKAKKCYNRNAGSRKIMQPMDEPI